MATLVQHLARAAGTQMVLASLTFPGVVESRAFARLMDRIFSALAPRYDRLGSGLAAPETVLAPLDSALRGLEPPRRILDVACGTGVDALFLARRWPAAEVAAVDLVEAMLRRLRYKHGRIGAAAAHAARLPFADRSFDLAVTQNAPPYPGELLRVLAPGGWMILAYSFAWAPVVGPCLARRLSRLGLDEVAVAVAGLGAAVRGRRPDRGP